MWHEFDPDRVTADLRAASAMGVRIVRTLLGWDAFMPSAAAVDTTCMRRLERFMAVAERESLQVVPTLFVQSLGDCVMLPAFAIDVGNPRRGVRVVTDGVVQPGGPRDVYVDPLMIEAQLLWLETLLSAFGGHSAIAWWDIGSDPAATARPRRFAHLREWATLMTATLRDRGERSGLTLAAEDIVTARGVRLDVVADLVDHLGIALDPLLLPIRAPEPSVAPTLFVTQLAQRLSGVDALHLHPGTCERNGDAVETLPECADAASVGRYAGDAVSALSTAGCGGLFAVQWSHCDARAAQSPPFDQAPRLSRRGLVDAAGAHTRFGESWSREVRHEREVQPAVPWPPRIDVESFYSNLPESVQDLYVAWEREQRDDPAMLN